MAHRKKTSPPGAKKLKRVGALTISDASRAAITQNLQRDPQKKVKQTVDGVTTYVSPYA